MDAQLIVVETVTKVIYIVHPDVIRKADAEQSGYGPEGPIEYIREGLESARFPTNPDGVEFVGIIEQGARNAWTVDWNEYGPQVYELMVEKLQEASNW